MGKNNLKSWFKWTVGLATTIASLAVSWAMIAGTLFIPKVPSWATVWSGWLLFVLTLVGVVIGLIGLVKKKF